MPNLRVRGALAGILGLALLLRMAGFENVLLPNGDVIFSYGDPYYQLRAGLVSLQAFPQVLHHDAWVNFPGGVDSVLPPLFHLVLAGLGLALGGSVRAFETGAALLGPVVGTLTVLPVFCAGRLLRGPRTGLLAATLVAVLPVSVLSGSVGNADYHAFLTLFGAVWLWGILLACTPGTSPHARLAAYAGVTLARTVVLTTWPGSLAYLGPADGLLFAAEALGGGAGGLLAHGVSLLVTAAVVAPVIASGPTPVGGAFSAMSLSQLHLLALLTLSGVDLALAALERARPAPGMWARAGRTLVFLAIGTVLVLAPAMVRTGLLAAADFLAARDPWVANNAEALPLFRFDPQGRQVAPVLYGAFVYALPLLPLAALALARDPARRAPGLVLAAWTSVLGLLAAAQMRYGSEFLVAYALCVAVALSFAARHLARRVGRRRAHALVLVGTALGLLPGLVKLQVPALVASATAFSAPRAPGDPALTLPVGSLVRFAEEIARQTPAQPGFLDPDGRPTYGVLVEPTIGHTILYAAGRATPAGNFGRFVGPAHYDDTERFFGASTEEEAIALSSALQSPWVVTTDLGGPSRGAKHVLHDLDGRGERGAPCWSRFRLVTEGPAGGRSLGELFGGVTLPGRPPYKLFERVPGAVLEVPAVPGAGVSAQVVVRTPVGRQFVYLADAVADDAGLARLRVPYATQTQAPARPVTPWRVRVGGETREVHVSDDDVRTGRTIRVDP